MERETRISITAMAACLIIVIGVGGYFSSFFLKIDEVPAEPIILKQTGFQFESTSEREV